mmetsp:Transcript_27698/g.81585  ORF Transcript_27698/g.81585 Transcript_27698/m.81585 type:complete len:217 (+) Transcript_27698:1286-1936(+)
MRSKDCAPPLDGVGEPPHSVKGRQLPVGKRQRPGRHAAQRRAHGELVRPPPDRPNLGTAREQHGLAETLRRVAGGAVRRAEPAAAEAQLLRPRERCLRGGHTRTLDSPSRPGASRPAAEPARGATTSGAARPARAGRRPARAAASPPPRAAAPKATRGTRRSLQRQRAAGHAANGAATATRAEETPAGRGRARRRPSSGPRSRRTPSRPRAGAPTA